MCGGGPFRDRGPSDEIVPTPYENPVCATGFGCVNEFSSLTKNAPYPLCRRG